MRSIIVAASFLAAITLLRCGPTPAPASATIPGKNGFDAGDVCYTPDGSLLAPDGGCF